MSSPKPSRKSLVGVSLLVWFIPSCFLLVQLARNGVTAIKAILTLPLMYGFALAVWLRWTLQQRWFLWIFAILLSVVLPAALVWLVIRAPRWRVAILAAGFILSCALAVVAYCMLRA